MQKKYSDLQAHLANKGFDDIKMTFEQIEAVIDDSLPASARKHRAWWSNNPANSVITHYWLAAGYKTSAVNMESETLVFRKQETSEAAKEEALNQSDQKTRPIFGCMQGMITIESGYDLTQPTASDWGDLDG